MNPDTQGLRGTLSTISVTRCFSTYLTFSFNCCDFLWFFTHSFGENRGNDGRETYDVPFTSKPTAVLQQIKAFGYFNLVDLDVQLVAVLT